MRKFGILLITLLIAMTSACALHISGLQDEQGRQTLYVFDDEHSAFAAAHGAIVSVIPDSPVKAAGGPMRGYSVAEKNLFSSEDEAAFTISILPGTGRSGGGGEIFGYYVEVSLRNESISGRLTAKKLYRAIVEVFGREGRPVVVDRIKLGQYRGGGFLRGGPERVDENGDLVAARSLAEELRELNELRLKGGLSREEYETLKARLMRE